MKLAQTLLRTGVRCACALTLATALLGTATAASPDVSPKSTSTVVAGADYTDLWWSPGQSGWGMQMVQTGTLLFATIYVYGPDGKATWFGGGMNPSGNAYTGKLYVTSGPYYGLPTFNSGAVTAREAGTVTFEPTDSDSGVLTYSVDKVVVKRNIHRQPLTLDNYEGVYGAILVQTVTDCVDAAKNASGTYSVGVQIAQYNDSISVGIANPAGDSCTISGKYTQAGRNGRVDGSYACESGDVGKAILTEMNTNHAGQFSSRVAMQSMISGCIADVAMTGMVPR